MAGSTPIYGFPYPQSTDLVADYPTLGQELATDVETVISGLGSGLNIMTPTSIANSGGSASASGGAVTFTGVSSISVNGVFTAAYANYLLLVTLVSSTDTGTTIRLRSAGTDNTSNSYTRQRLVVDTTSVTAAVVTDTYWYPGSINTNRNTHNLVIFGPQLAQNTTFEGKTQYGNSAMHVVAGTHAVASAFDGFTMAVQSGNITGILRVYGYEN